MNVAFDPWIPVVTTSGKLVLASLCDVLTKGEQFVDLAVRPHERVALMRLFLCIAHAALCGPKDYDEWCEVPDRFPEAVQKYLTDWKDSFELFHKEKPWLQIAGLSKSANGKTPPTAIENWTPVSKLNFSLATGNNATLFDHSGMSESRGITLSETVLSMLAFQCFLPGAFISQVYWNGKQSGRSSKDGPCVPASMIHAFLRGKNLLGTIHLNLPTYEDVQFSYGERDFGKPVWEMMPTSMADSAKVENATATYVGRLVPMKRLILLHPSLERMLLGDGLIYPTFTDGFPPEPTATVVIRQKEEKEEQALLSYRPTKALWRELSAVIVKRQAEGSGGPLSLRAIQDGKGYDLIVAALARDKATIVDTVESIFHIPEKFNSIEGTAIYSAEVKNAETMASRLGWAVEAYREETDYGWEGKLKAAGPSKGALKARLHSIATSHYWPTVEKNLPILMTHIEAIGTDAAIPTRESWRKMLFSSAAEAYRISCGQATPRHMRAFAKGWQKLTVIRDEPETNINETTEGMGWLLERLHKHKDNWEMMANLRCVFVDNKKHRAWPALNRLGIAIKDYNSAYIAGLFATHPKEASTGNFGATCKAIEQKRGEERSDDSKLTSTERRFQHLLAAERAELYGRILRLVLMAKSQGIPVNYEKLIPDLKFWGNRTKTEWASAFWKQSATPLAEEDK